MIARLADAIAAKGAPVVVGLDPNLKFVPKHLMDEAVRTHAPSENGDDALAAWVYAWRGIALDALACGNKAAAKKAVEKALSFPENLGRGKPYDPPGRGTPEKPGLLADWPDSLMELL